MDIVHHQKDMLDNTNEKIKTCKKCNLPKKLHFFHKCSSTKNGYRNICKTCKKTDHHNDYIKNKLRYFENNKKWRKNNKQKLKLYYIKDGIKRKNYFKNYRITHRKERSLYAKEKQLTDINYKLSLRLRHRVYMALKSKKIKKLHRTMDLLGCNIEKFKLHLQSQFKNGMTWENYGKWHIDHIKPCINFNLSDGEEQKTCFHYTNMQPLWATDNLHKWKN